MNNRVFILKTTKRHFDISSTGVFGDVVYLISEDEHIPSVFDTVAYQNALVTRLRAYDYDPTRDYVCVVGAMVPVTNFIVCVAKEWRIFKVLLFSSTENKYVERTFGSNRKGDEHGLADAATSKSTTSVQNDKLDVRRHVRSSQ